MAKGAIKKFLFNLTPAQLVFSLIVILGILLFFVFKLISGFASNVSGSQSPLLALILLTIALLLTRLSILAKVGIGFMPFILFGVQMVFGPAVSFAMVLVTSYIYIKIATKPYWFDFLISKGVSSAMAQTIYLGLWTGALMVLFKLLTVEYILSNLVFVYMVSLLIYIIFMSFCLPFFSQEPVPLVLVNGMMMAVFGYFLMKYAGVQFINYLMSLSPL